MPYHGVPCYDHEKRGAFGGRAMKMQFNISHLHRQTVAAAAIGIQENFTHTHTYKQTQSLARSLVHWKLQYVLTCAIIALQ